MPRLTLLSLGMVAGLLAAAPAGAAVTPKTLPIVAKTLKAAKGKSCTTTSYRAPLTGFLDVRLRGSGDWDLTVKDAKGLTLATSNAFGGREVGQAWVRGGQRISAVGCRHRGAGSSAKTTFRLSSIALPKLPLGTAQVLRVRGTEQQLAGLEAARPRRHRGARGRLGGRRRQRPQGPDDRHHVGPALQRARRQPREGVPDRPRRRPSLHGARRRGRLAAADGAHDVPHVRRRPERAEGARRPEPGARAQEGLRDLLPGPRDRGRRDLQERQRRRRAPGVLLHGAAPRPRVAVAGGRDGVRPHARPAAGRPAHRRPARARADRDPAARQPRRLHLLARHVRRRRLAHRPEPERHARRGDRAARRPVRLPAQELRRRVVAVAAVRARGRRRPEPQLRLQLGRLGQLVGHHVAELPRSRARARSPRRRPSGTSSARIR